MSEPQQYDVNQIRNQILITLGNAQASSISAFDMIVNQAAKIQEENNSLKAQIHNLQQKLKELETKNTN